MPAKDIYHELVKTALVKEGWQPCDGRLRALDHRLRRK
ncbi:MAG: element excision factor XisH family protein [Blastocatellia bacterium]